MNVIMKRIEDLKNDHSHGASELVAQTLEILKDAARQTDAAGSPEFVEEITAICRELMVVKPSMIAINNIVCKFMAQFNDRDKYTDVETLRAHRYESAANLERLVVQAKEKTIVRAANFIPEGITIMTCSFSSTIIEVCRRVWSLGKSIQVQILNSRCGIYNYGEIAAKRLNQLGIQSTIIADELTKVYVPMVDLILLGADSILMNGSVINGYPSLNLAQTAFYNNPPVPVYAICESTKISPNTNTIALEEGFELIPGNWLAGIITENGVVKPGSNLSSRWL